MKQIKIMACFFTAALFFIGCNQPATNPEKKETDTTSVPEKRDTLAIPAYDPAMEPLAVLAQFSKKIGDTLGIKMYEFTINPGDSAALHSHPDHIWYVIQGGKLAITFQGMGRRELELKPGMGAISGPLSDAGKNIGNTTVKLLVVDIYRPRSK